MLRSARVGAYLCWFLVAGGAAAFGCGGGEKQSGEASGSDGGATVGGNGSALGGAAGSAVSRTGGADTGVGGSAGSPSDSGGADSSGGSGVGGITDDGGAGDGGSTNAGGALTAGIAGEGGSPGGGDAGEGGSPKGGSAGEGGAPMGGSTNAGGAPAGGSTGEGGLAGQSGAGVGSGGTERPVLDLPTCGGPVPGFNGTLCGLETDPCRVLVDEILDATPVWRNPGPALATDANGRPHVIYYTADLYFYGYYAVRDEGGWQTERMEMPIAGASLAIGGDAAPVALVNNGELPGASLWKRVGDSWVRIDASDFDDFESYGSGSLIATQDNCYHAAFEAPASAGGLPSCPAYGLWDGQWNLISFGYSLRRTLTPGLAVAPSGEPELAMWFYDADGTGTVHWVARGGSPEPIDTAHGLQGTLGNPTRAFLALAVDSTDQTRPHALYRALPDIQTSDPVRYNLVEAWRTPDGSWNRQIIASSTGITYADCGVATEGSPPCDVYVTDVVPVGIVGSAGDSVRTFFTTTHSAGTLTTACTPPIGGGPEECGYFGDIVSTTRLEMASREADGSVSRSVIVEMEGTAPYLEPAVAVDVNGNIHIVLFEGEGDTIVRYLMLGP